MTNKLFSYSLIFLFLIVLFHVQTSYAQPYYPTHVKNDLVDQNIFKDLPFDLAVPPTFEESKEKLPKPTWKANPDVVKSYWRAWEIAFSNLKNIDGKNGFVSPYADPAFNGSIFMWDCSFMMMYGKYARSAFDFQNTLNNFYAKQHPDGFICREIRKDGTDVFQRFDPSSTGPNIMPWAEWEYFKNFNDKDRLKKVFPVLLAFYNWYSTYRTWPDGTYYSSGWGCGMDNQHRVTKQYSAEFSHGFMSWIDISFQEIYAGKILIEMAKVLDRENDVVEIKKQQDRLSKQINSSMWNEDEKYYFDRYKTGELNTTMSIGSYWGLLAGTIPENRINDMVDHLQDTSKFDRKHRVPTLSASDPNYEPNRGYWNGGVWAPTTYMVLRGLTENKFDSLAYEIGSNHVHNVTKVFNETNTFWENYAPDKVKGEFRSDFVGWTGLAPISVLLEYVFGIRPNVPDNELVIDVNLTDEYGVTDYPYGVDGMIDILCKKRKNKDQKPKIVITSNVPIKVIVKWAGNKIEKNIKAGKTSL